MGDGGDRLPGPWAAGRTQECRAALASHRGVSALELRSRGLRIVRWEPG